MSKKFVFKGACTELLAPFDDDFNLNYDALDDEVSRQLDAGISALFLNGLATEALLTTHEERLAMTKATVERVAKKVPVISNIVTNVPATSLELVKKFEAVGVDAICVTQPMVYPYSADGIFKYFSDIAKSTKLPVYVYNAPESSNTLSPSLVAKIVNNNDNVVGYKDSTKDIVHLTNVMSLIDDKDGFQAVAGSDSTIFPTLTVGGVGIISLISAVFPKPVIDVCDAYFKGDIKKSFENQKYVLDIRTALKDAPFLSGYKYAAGLIGMHLGRVRPPLVEISEAQKEKIKKNLTALNLV